MVVSSSRDAHHTVLYPTPPFALSAAARKQIPDNVSFVSDPCLLDVDGLVVAITTTDVLKHLGPSEISRYWIIAHPYQAKYLIELHCSQGSDRLGRLASHILHQACFYPLHPGQTSVHLEAWEKHAQMPVKPHVLVLPSDLRFFVKVWLIFFVILKLMLIMDSFSCRMWKIRLLWILRGLQRGWLEELLPGWKSANQLRTSPSVTMSRHKL